MLNFWLSRTIAVKRVKVPEALPMRLFVYFSSDAFDETFELRYAKFLHFRYPCH